MSCHNCFISIAFYFLCYEEKAQLRMMFHFIFVHIFITFKSQNRFGMLSLQFFFQFLKDLHFYSYYTSKYVEVENYMKIHRIAHVKFHLYVLNCDFEP